MKYSTQVRYGRFDARISSISASEAKQAISCPRIMATTAIPIKSNAMPENPSRVKSGKEKAVWNYNCQKERGLEPK